MELSLELCLRTLKMLTIKKNFFKKTKPLKKDANNTTHTLLFPYHDFSTSTKLLEERKLQKSSRVELRLLHHDSLCNKPKLLASRGTG